MEISKQKIQVYWSINWLRRSLIGLLVLLVIVLVLPIVVQFTLSHQLKKMGASHADIDDINLNLFTGSFEIRQLQYATNTNEPAELNNLSLDINVLDLFASKVVIKHLLVEGLKANISRQKNGEISISGLNIPMQDASSAQAETEQTADPLMFAIEHFSLRDSSITYREEEFEQVVAVDSLSLKGIRSWEAGSTAEMATDLKLNTAGMRLQTDLSLFSEQRKLTGQLELKGIDVSDFSKFYREHLIRLQGVVTLTTHFDVTLGDSIEVKLNSNMLFRELDADYQNINLRSAAVRWKGNTVYSSVSPWAIKGDLSVNNNVLYDRKDEYLLSAFEELSISGLTYDADGLHLDSIQTKNLQIIDLPQLEESQKNLFVGLEAINIENFSHQQTKAELNIEKIELSNPQLKLLVNKDKQLTHITALTQSLQSLSQGTAENSSDDNELNQTAEAKQLAIRIDEVRLQKAGAIDITDNSVSPAYKSVIHLNEINIEGVSSDSPAKFELKLGKGDYTDIDVTGKGLLLDPTHDLQLTASIRQLDLPPVTPYSSHFMGYGMQSGVVDSDIQLKLSKREIDSVVDLKIDSIKVVETNKETAEQVLSASGMSLDLAAATLKDSNNVITLKLPIKGNIENPDFDLSLIINKAMGNAMKSAALSYLKHALQPFGSMITLVQLAKAAADHITLPPILFLTNNLDFKEQQQDLLDKVVKIMQERPGIKIKACGVSSLDDWRTIEAELIAIEQEKLKKQNKKVDKITIAKESIQQKARDLADQRSAKVKAYLVSNGKLEKSRVLNCLSATNLEEKSVASVELQI